MAKPEKVVDMDIYPCADGYVCKFQAPTNATGSNKKKKDVATKIILDRSGSMGNNVQYLTNLILPQVFSNLGYSSTQEIHLLAFDTSLKEFRCTLEKLPQVGLKAGGGTTMSIAVDALVKDIGKNPPKNLRVLTISDGELADQEATVTASEKLSGSIFANCSINSRAIRFFTSSSQPDTRGLASVIRWSTMNANEKQADSQLIDIDCHDPIEQIMATIVSLFDNDGLDTTLTLKASESTMSQAPWKEPAKSLIVNPNGENVIWLNRLPLEGSLKFIEMPDVIVRYRQHEALNFDSATTILTSQLEFFKYRMKVLKILRTPNSQEELQKMMVYFNKLVSWFESIEAKNSSKEDGSNPTSLRARLAFTKALSKKRTKTIFNELRQIANEDNVDKFNAAQQASYLRSADVSRNSKGLARRVIDHGLDFSQVTRDEVRKMREHLHELDGIDDKDHTVSFYSMETTLGGVKAVCQLTDVELDTLEAADILPIMNVVGVACYAKIGDYPDAMTWRPTAVIPGCHVSVADLMARQLQAGSDEDLMAPGTDQPISNVLPIFDDIRIQKFLQKYAPSILDYLCGVGMRRMIGQVPLTYVYTICAGAWKMVELLNTNKSEVNVMTFVNLVRAYEVAASRAFNHVIKLFETDSVSQKPDADGKVLSAYILNNGWTNMFYPLMHLIKNKKISIELMQAVLRAVYAYEVYQGTRKLYKREEKADELLDQLTTQLAGIDLEKHRTDVGPLFESPMDPVFYDQWHLDQELFDRIEKVNYFLKYIGLVPKLLEAIYTPDPIEAVRKIPSLTDEIFRESLGISYPLEEFKYFNMLQGLLYNCKALRVHATEPRMLILDLGIKEQAVDMVRSYVVKQYKNLYTSEMTKKSKQEKQIIAKEFVNLLVEAPEIEEFVRLLSEGTGYRECRKYPGVKFSIETSSSLGFLRLKEKLLDMKNEVPHRLAKLSILLLGRDSTGKEIWNRGGVLLFGHAEFKKTIVDDMHETEFWDEMMAEYQKRCVHVYRGGDDKANRHGHSNDKRSYWARGFKTLLAMKEAVSESDWAEYIAVHCDCCGVNRIDG